MAGAIVPYRPVTSVDRVNALDALVDAVKPLFNDVYDRSANYPEFIRSDEARSPIFDAARSVARLNCRLWAASDKSNYSTRANLGNAELCGPYLDGLGENPDGGDLRLPFSGGQCPVRYFVTAKWKNRNVDGSLGAQQQQNVTSPIGRPGPIRGIERRGQSGSWQMVLLHGTDSVFTAPESVVRSSTSTQAAFEELSIVSVATVNGAADNCGNPTPIIRPPNTVTPVTPIAPRITVNLPGLPNVEVEVSVNVDGSPKVCIPILGVCDDIEINPDVDIPGGGGGGTPPLDPEVGPPIDSPPGGGGGGNDTDFGEPPEGRIWIGAYVQLLGDLGPFGVIPRDLTGQAALSTVVGNASLNVQSDGGLTLRSTFTQIRSEWSEHIAPVVGLTVSGIRVKVNPSLGYRVYPVSVADPLAEST